MFVLSIQIWKTITHPADFTLDLISGSRRQKPTNGLANLNKPMAFSGRSNAYIWPNFYSLSWLARFGGTHLTLTCVSRMRHFDTNVRWYSNIWNEPYLLHNHGFKQREHNCSFTLFLFYLFNSTLFVWFFFWFDCLAIWQE